MLLEPSDGPAAAVLVKAAQLAPARCFASAGITVIHRTPLLPGEQVSIARAEIRASAIGGLVSNRILSRASNPQDAGRKATCQGDEAWRELQRDRARVPPLAPVIWIVVPPKVQGHADEAISGLRDDAAARVDQHPCKRLTCDAVVFGGGASSQLLTLTTMLREASKFVK